MEQERKIQRMSVYFPLDLLEQVRTHADAERRSFNKDVLWLLERALREEGTDATGRTARHRPPG
ncbi:MAG TPA: Arc family DNA-binding protein [Ktedonobacterales bacterium]